MKSYSMNITGRDFNYDAQLGKGDLMSAKQQRKKSTVLNRGAQPSREERFWPFDPWDPWDPSDPGKSDPTSGLGSDSGYFSIKNYPSFTRGPVTKKKKSRSR